MPVELTVFLVVSRDDVVAILDGRCSAGYA